MILQWWAQDIVCGPFEGPWVGLRSSNHLVLVQVQVVLCKGPFRPKLVSGRFRCSWTWAQHVLFEKHYSHVPTGLPMHAPVRTAASLVVVQMHVHLHCSGRRHVLDVVQVGSRIIDDVTFAFGNFHLLPDVGTK